MIVKCIKCSTNLHTICVRDYIRNALPTLLYCRKCKQLYFIEINLQKVQK